MRAPPIPRGVARRVDHLARAAHAFHRFAHHPLCEEYAPEVIAIGRRRICRGCAMAAVGALAGAAAGILAHPALAVATAAIPAALAFASLRVRAAGKIPRRLAPAALIAFAIVAGTRAGGAAGLGIAAAGIASGFLFVRRYRARGPDRKPCATCPEREGIRPCRGLAPIVRRERAFRRLAGSWIDAQDASATSR